MFDVVSADATIFVNLISLLLEGVSFYWVVFKLSVHIHFFNFLLMAFQKSRNM